MNLNVAKNIDGWISDKELIFLAEQARDAKYILEIGSYKGKSTRALADNTNGIIFAVDPWDGTYYNDKDEPIDLIHADAFQYFLENLKEHINSKRVIPIKLYSQDFTSVVKFDFIFIDGDHRYETVKHDIELAKKLIARNGVIAGHDYTHSDWPGVRKAVDEIFGPISYVDSIWYKRME